MTVTVDEFEVADPPHAWMRAGFSVDSGVHADPVCRVGDVRIRLVGRDRGTGIIGWSLRGLPSLGSFDDFDGIATAQSTRAPAEPASHPNGVTAIDHVVLLTPDLGRTVASLAAIGVDPRRERDAELGGRRVRQVFFRFGEVIIEVVGSPETASDDCGVHKGEIGPDAGLHDVAPAVELGMSVRTAMISANHRL
ncbi:glyoxalase [Mycolicibacterium sp. CBMA 334]|uniref:glyoxalase n=1 Tax=Mycolicibacterium sp. CBMA 334 TaxID=2606607 RepID=UPI002001E207|nr:glyoxalase [Mycolicibacterium sp. CBMA 334]